MLGHARLVLTSYSRCLLRYLFTAAPGVPLGRQRTKAAGRDGKGCDKLVAFQSAEEIPSLFPLPKNIFAISVSIVGHLFLRPHPLERSRFLLPTFASLGQWASPRYRRYPDSPPACVWRKAGAWNRNIPPITHSRGRTLIWAYPTPNFLLYRLHHIHPPHLRRTPICSIAMTHSFGAEPNATTNQPVRLLPISLEPTWLQRYLNISPMSWLVSDPQRGMRPTTAVAMDRISHMVLGTPRDIKRNLNEVRLITGLRPRSGVLFLWKAIFPLLQCCTSLHFRYENFQFLALNARFHTMHVAKPWREYSVAYLLFSVHIDESFQRHVSSIDGRFSSHTFHGALRSVLASFTYLLIHLFTHWFIDWLIDSFIYLFIACDIVHLSAWAGTVVFFCARQAITPAPQRAISMTWLFFAFCFCGWSGMPGFKNNRGWQRNECTPPQKESQPFSGFPAGSLILLASPPAAGSTVCNFY